MLRKGNGIIDISSALTASKAASRVAGAVMFVSPWEPRVVAEVGLAGILNAVSDLAHTSLLGPLPLAGRLSGKENTLRVGGPERIAAAPIDGPEQQFVTARS